MGKTTRKRRQKPRDDWRHAIEKDIRGILRRQGEQERSIGALKDQMSGVAGEIRTQFGELAERLDQKFAFLEIHHKGIPARVERLENRIEQHQEVLGATKGAAALVEDLRELIDELKRAK